MTKNAKTAYVFGATGSIGSAVAERCLLDGWDVIGFVRTERDDVESRLAVAADGCGRGLAFVKADMTREEELSSAITSALEVYGCPGGVAICSGATSSGLIASLRLGELQRVFEINLFAPLIAMRELSLPMARAGGGSIVALSSIVGEDYAKGLAAYGSSKAALSAAVGIAAKEFSRFGIRVNAVAPGIIEGGMEEGLTDKRRGELLRSCPMGREGAAAEIASAVAFLLSDDSSYISGETIRVDGGI